MKKIITSLGMLVFVGALVAGATGAFFSDTETSTGNVFTAGAIDLTVDSQQHYNNAVCVDGQWALEAGEVADNPQYPVIGSDCDGTWTATNLGAEKFWNFTDVKPGDEGENTISLHVDSNDAYACVDVNITKNDDVTCTDPENDAEGIACQNSVPSADFDGELAQNLEFFAWADTGSTAGFQGLQDVGEGDNIWQANEEPLFSNIIGPASDALDGESYTLANSVTGPLAGGSTSYIGMAWCAGDLTTTGPGLLNCDGSTMGNDAQTDSMVANVAFRIEQARNNENFTCIPQVAPVITTLTLAKSVIPDLQHPDSAFVLSAAGPTPISGVEGAGTVTAAPVTPGVYTLSETDGGFTGAVVTWSCIGNATPEVDNLDGTATVTVAPGESVGCVVTNDYTQQL